MRRLLICPILLLAACNAVSNSEIKAKMAACGDSTQPDAAISACTHLIQKETLPNAARVYLFYSRGRAAMQKQDMAAALSDLDEAIRLDPSQHASFATRGIVHGTLGEMKAAINDFDRAIELNPEDGVTFQNRGKAYSDIGEHRQAIQDFSRAIKLGNAGGATHNGRCWARAVLDEELELAREDCEAAVRLEPMDGNNSNSLAFVRFRTGDYAGAISGYTSSLSLNPQGASSYYMRGMAKARINDPTASADIEKGMSLEPGIAQRYAGYGVTP